MTLYAGRGGAMKRLEEKLDKIMAERPDAMPLLRAALRKRHIRRLYDARIGHG